MATGERSEPTALSRPAPARSRGRRYLLWARRAVIEALDRLRGLRETTPPRLLVILGASGSGKSSFLRAGLLPRLKRDDRHFLPLPIIRPERAAINGETGFLSALEEALKAAGSRRRAPSCERPSMAVARSSAAAAAGACRQGARCALDAASQTKTANIVLSVDQGEELFLGEGQDEARAFLALAA